MAGRTVVALKSHDHRPREVLLEAEDVVDFGSAPSVDRLVVIANAADILTFLREQAQPKILDDVRVLILIDKDVTKTPLVICKDVEMLTQHA